jgi:hypothetical protein
MAKGPDRSKAYLQKIIDGEETPIDEETNTRNEVREYLDAWYIYPLDSCWWFSGFEIQRHFPSVDRTTVRLPDENYVTYNAEVDMSQIVSQEFLHRTMLTEWFVANQRYPEARNLLYCDFPSRWWWDEKTRAW